MINKRWTRPVSQSARRPLSHRAMVVNVFNAATCSMPLGRWRRRVDTSVTQLTLRFSRAPLAGDNRAPISVRRHMAHSKGGADCRLCVPGIVRPQTRQNKANADCLLGGSHAVFLFIISVALTTIRSGVFALRVRARVRAYCWRHLARRRLDWMAHQDLRPGAGKHLAPQTALHHGPPTHGPHLGR